MSKLILQVKRIILFLISPFIALAYMAAIPIVAVSMLKEIRKARVGDNGESIDGHQTP
ncbi:MAG: hypothetical protein AB7E72_20935 [Lysobacterales bacterium]